MVINLCISCGDAFALDEMVDGICLECYRYYKTPEEVPLDFDELYDKISDKASLWKIAEKKE